MQSVRAATLIVAAILLTGCAFLAKPSTSLKEQYRVQTSKLKNGMTLTVQSDSAVPLVTMDMWVRVGSGDETPEIAGISHFLEHMLFKGTPNLAVGEYDRRIEELGGYLNAGTTMDYTHYYVTVPSQHFDVVLRDFADVLVNSSIDAKEVESERQVILEEIRRKVDSPFGFLFDETLPSLFATGPYTHTVIGSSETVTAITREQLADHYKRFYAPSNMFLNIVGNVDWRKTQEKVETIFADFNRPYTPYRKEAPMTSFAKPTTRVLERDWNESYFILAFPGRGEPATLKAMAQNDIAGTLIAGNRSARLKKNLVEKKQLVTSIDTWFPNNRHAGPLMIYGTCEIGKETIARDAILAELAEIQKDGFTAGELRRAKRDAVTSHLFAVETNAGRASTLGYSQTMLGNVGMLHDYRAALEAVTEEEALAIIRGSMRPELATLTVTRKALPGETLR